MNGNLKVKRGSDEWYANKIKGGIAEATCRAHFEALGYKVESSGFEHIAPQYMRVSNLRSGNYMGSVKAMQNLPDYVISRVHPNSNSKAGMADAAFIEVKFRHKVILEDFTKELIGKYDNLIKKNIHFIVYLVCDSYKKNRSCQDYKNDSFVFLNFINLEMSKTKDGSTGWKMAGEDKNKLDTYDLYQGKKGGKNFNEVYRDIVHPLLSKMLV